MIEKARQFSVPFLIQMNKGILYILIATACFAVVNAFVKDLDRIPTSEIVFFRSVITLVITLFLSIRLGLPFPGNNKKWLFIRGFTGAAALVLFFTTIKEMPMATATTIQYLSPVFTVIISMILFKDKVKFLRWVFFAIAFAGVLMIKGFDHRVSWNMLMLGILSAFLSGIAYNAIIKCKPTDHPLTIVLAFPLIAAPITGIWAFTEWITPEGNEWWSLLIIGLFTQVAQVFMTMALHAEKAYIITPFKYLGTIYALFIGFFWFDETFSLLAILGMILVIIGVVLNAINK